MAAKQADFTVENHGSICLIRPLSPACVAWLDENVGEDSQHFGRALVVEPRYVSNLLDGLESAGLVSTQLSE